LAVKAGGAQVGWGFQLQEPAVVIALAPYADEVERLLLQQAGVFGYLLKYIDSGRLIQVIETAAQRGLSPLASSS